ncbi:TatD family deoxyribonuclease [Candidatus Uhrbacteria bacterium]|nr:TatD family deoxyribonuclease [Candidatus Uhrbacteria bacterium]
MMPYLIDSHSHPHAPLFDPDCAEVLARMSEKRIWTIAIGTSINDSARAIEFAEHHPGVWATVGLHPEYLTSSFVDPADASDIDKTFDRERFRELARSSKKVVAIGETGLDYYRIDEGRDREEAMKIQESIFREHLALAAELDLPIVVHCRDALTRLAEMLTEQPVRGVVHSFTGTWKEAEPLLELGMSIAVNGIATFPPRKNANTEDQIDRTIERIPLDRLLIETDAPYLAPVPYRGKRNEPAWVEEVAQHVARVRGISLEAVAEATTKNCIKLFDLS